MPSDPERRTKILVTLGPATESPEVIERLLAHGADAFRLNFSHGEHDDHARRVETIRGFEAKLGRPVCILQDLQGPKIRTGTFADSAGVVLDEGQSFRLTIDDSPGDATRVGTTFPALVNEVTAGQRLLLNDGLVELRVVAVDPDGLDCRVAVGGPVSDHKGINLPDADLSVPALTAKDIADLELGAELGVDWVALSFVRRAADLLLCRGHLERVGSTAKLMAKIEKPGAVARFGEILEAADGIMVARGDLGVEMQPWEVPPIQKRLLRECILTGKPVVVATQMLEAMIHNPLPTRAEASDVANAIYDGADAVMLSGETAVGRYPVETVSMMSRLATAAEQSADYRHQIYCFEPTGAMSVPDAVCDSAHRMAEMMLARVIASFTWSGATARRIARHRPTMPIVALTVFPHVARQLALSWGVVPVVMDHPTNSDHMSEDALGLLRSKRLVVGGDAVVLTAGVPFGEDGNTNLLRVERVME